MLQPAPARVAIGNGPELMEPYNNRPPSALSSKHCQNGKRPAGDLEPAHRIEPSDLNQGRSAQRKAAEITEQIRGTGSEGTGEDVSDAAAADIDATDDVEEVGPFRIYLGAAPGVGKTYAMLSEGHRRRGRGADVVAGFVESYGRPHTEELINGLEVIPRKAVDYRGRRLEEMDLDAVLRR
jgi:Osmosensitive K+ channel His kinase sensor domain